MYGGRGVEGDWKMWTREMEGLGEIKGKREKQRGEQWAESTALSDRRNADEQQKCKTARQKQMKKAE